MSTPMHPNALFGFGHIVMAPDGWNGEDRLRWHGLAGDFIAIAEFHYHEEGEDYCWFIGLRKLTTQSAGGAVVDIRGQIAALDVASDVSKILLARLDQFVRDEGLATACTPRPDWTLMLGAW